MVFRIVIAFIVTAFWLPALMAIITPNYSFIGSEMIEVFTVLLTLIIGVPCYVFFRDRITFKLCINVGSIAGILGAIIFLLLTSWDEFSHLGVPMIAIGVWSGVVFWVVGFANSKTNKPIKTD